MTFKLTLLGRTVLLSTVECVAFFCDWQELRESQQDLGKRDLLDSSRDRVRSEQRNAICLDIGSPRLGKALQIDDNPR